MSKKELIQKLIINLESDILEIKQSAYEGLKLCFHLPEGRVKFIKLEFTSRLIFNIEAKNCIHSADLLVTLYTKGNTDLRQKMLDKQFMQQVVSLLKKGSAEAKTLAAKILHDLAYEDSLTCSEIIRAGAIIPLVKLLATADQKTQCLAIEILQLLVDSGDCISNCKKIAEANPTSSLIKLLDINKPDIQISAAQLLNKLSFYYDCKALVRKQIVETNDLSPLKNLLHSKASEKAKELVIETLKQLIDGFAERLLIKKLSEADIIPSLVSLLNTPEKQILALNILYYFSMLSDALINAKIANAGAIPALVRLLDLNNELYTTHGATALLNKLAENNHDLQLEIVRAGAIPSLVVLLSSKDGQLRGEVRMTLNTLTTSESAEVQSAIIETGVIANLTELSNTESHARKEAISLLARFSTLNSRRQPSQNQEPAPPRASNYQPT